MKDLRRLLGSLEPFFGTEATAGLKWQYEQARAQGKILLPPPPQGAVNGPYSLGNVIWNEKTSWFFGLQEKELPQHISIFGRTGSGKTNCAFLLLHQLIEKRKPFLIFDWKQSYRSLSSNHASHQPPVDINRKPPVISPRPPADIGLLTPGCSHIKPFYFNPLDLSQIPKQLQSAYLRQLLSVLLNTYFRDLKLLSVEGVEYLLLRGMDYLKQEKKTFTFQDLYHWAIHFKGMSRERDWKSSLLNVLYKLTTGPIGEVLNPNQEIAPFTIEDLIHNRTIIELQWLGSPKDKSFLMQVLLLQIYYHFSQQQPTQETKFAILIEEAHNILLKHNEDYETVIEMILRQVREYGVSICLLDQHPSLMSLPALGTYTTFSFNLKAREDIDVMSSVLNLEEDREFLAQLKTGQAIVKLQDRFLKPFLVEFRNAQDSNSRRQDSSFLLKPAQDFPKDQKPQITPFQDFPVTGGISPKSKIKEKNTQKLTQEFPTRAGISSEFKGFSPISKPDKVKDKIKKKENPQTLFLIDVFENPLIPVIDRYKCLNTGSKQGNQLKRKLIENSLLKPILISAGTQRIKLFELTEFGKQHLRDRGIDTEKGNRKGGIEHQFWAAKTQSQYEKSGYGVLEEITIGKGRAVDLVAIKEDQKIAIEIETGKSDYIGNIEKCQKGNFERIVVIATSKKVKDRIKKKVKASIQNKIPIVVVTGSEMIKLIESRHL